MGAGRTLVGHSPRACPPWALVSGPSGGRRCSAESASGQAPALCSLDWPWLPALQGLGRALAGPPSAPGKRCPVRQACVPHLGCSRCLLAPGATAPRFSPVHSSCCHVRWWPGGVHWAEAGTDHVTGGSCFGRNSLGWRPFFSLTVSSLNDLPGLLRTWLRLPVLPPLLQLCRKEQRGSLSSGSDLSPLLCDC